MTLKTPDLKRKLRQLRQLELTLRFGRVPAPNHPPLVWDAYFSAREADSRSVKYPLAQLLQLEREEFKAILDDYFARVYAQTAQDQRPMRADIYDPQLLARLGLPPYAASDEIKRRFRALAMQHHPDRGGDPERFIELVATYERLTDEPEEQRPS